MIDIIVVGGGHAGCEAALAAARLGKQTLLITGNFDMVASMPCNPSIGGPAKGTLVREIDALGGEMAKVADKTCLQMKMLNKSKGPAVWALRAQSDKRLYSKTMLQTLKNTDNLELLEIYACDLLETNGKITGVRTEDKTVYHAKKVILSTGTFMEAKVLIGHEVIHEGPDKQKPSHGISAGLRDFGFKTMRLKTGTPPRIKTETVDFSKMKLSPGDGFIYHFSHDPSHLRVLGKEWPCYLIHTDQNTHEIVLDHLQDSAMYGGQVEGVGPRYCPSFEDKLVRFSDKKRHQLFIEPESAEIDELYLQGFSSSMPRDVQKDMVHSLPGFKNAVIAKYAYAIEYDAIDPRQLWPSLESKITEGLYLAGQVNGTSGYEEAAAQGLIAGINAARALDGKEPVVLRRDEAYIGVLIDDLITKGTKEPYRMLTSRAEFRLLLRHDNADRRLMDKGYAIGLLEDCVYQAFKEKQAAIKAETKRLKNTTITPTEKINARLEKDGYAPIKKKTSLYGLLKRPEIAYSQALRLIGEKPVLPDAISEQIKIEATYRGYIKKALKNAEKMKKDEAIRLPADLDYDKVGNIANEARQKLSEVRPLTIGQAMRISGVNPSDVQMVLVHLKKNNLR